ncbi:HAD family hydrolase [Anaerolineales bacterium HSG24]|nr:HAD family hydrolase [Anaerolineales bacterium HSG24]
MKNSSIKAITFDFWSTLYRQPTNRHERIKELRIILEQYHQQNIALDDFERATKIAKTTWLQSWIEEYHTPNAQQWLEFVLAELNISIASNDKANIVQIMENSLLANRPHLVDNAAHILADLSTRYKLAIISDTGTTPGRVLRQVLAHDEILIYFSHLTFSDELGHSKPHHKPFLATLEQLDCQPAQAVHIGDLLRTDIQGAKNVGMRAIQYTGFNEDTYSQTEVIPDAVINSYEALNPLLAQWSTHT